MSCASLEGLLYYAADHDKLASISSIIDILEMRGCIPDLDEAARGAVEHNQIGSTLFLIARGASNYNELIRMANDRGNRTLAFLIQEKLGRVGRRRYY